MTMDPVPATIAVAVAVALVTTIGVLWRRIDKNEKASTARETSCNERNEALGKEIKETKDRLLDIYKQRAEQAEAKAEVEARRAMAMEETSRTCAKVLKRFENTPIPDDRSGGTSALHRIPGT